MGGELSRYPSMLVLAVVSSHMSALPLTVSVHMVKLEAVC